MLLEYDPPHSTKSLGWYLGRARRYISANDAAGANDLYQEAMHVHGRRPELAYLQGLILETEGKPEQATWRYEEATRGELIRNEASYRMAILHYKQGDYRTAIYRLRIVAEQTNFSAIWAELADVHIERGDHDEAIECLDRAIERDPGRSLYRVQAASLLAKSFRLSRDARDRLDVVIDAQASTPEEVLLRGRALLIRGQISSDARRYSEALEDMEGALAEFNKCTESDHVLLLVREARMSAALYCLMLKRYSAGRSYAQSLVSDPDSAFSIFASYLLGSEAVGRLDYPEMWSYWGSIYEAQKVAAGAENWNPEGVARILFDIAVVVYDFDLAARTLTLMKENAKTDRDAVEAIMCEVFLLQTREENSIADVSRGYHGKMRDVARSACERIKYRIDAGVDAGGPETLSSLGNLYLTLGDWESAEKYLRQAISLDSAFPDVASNLGVALAAQGRRSEALSSLRAALLVESNDATAILYIAEIHRQQDAFPSAEEVLRGLLSREPGRLRAKLLLAQVLIEKGESESADEYVEASELLRDAISESSSEIGLPANKRRGPEILGRKQLAEACYLRGYALTKRYELGAKQFVPRPGGSLELALRSFREALLIDPEHDRARRAVSTLNETRSSERARTIIERVAVPILGSIVLAILVLAQLAYFFSIARLETGYWVTSTLGLIVLIIAIIVLPNLLKLKVAGVELEKSAQGPIENPRIGLVRGESGSDFRAFVSRSIGEEKPVPRRGPSSPLGELPKEGNEPLRQTNEGVSESEKLHTQ